MRDMESPESAVKHLMTPDLVLPEQFFSRNADAMTGERSLQWAVFADGIEMYRRLAHSRSRAAQREFHKVRAWVLKDDGDWLYSFENLCTAFDFEPEAVREALLRFGGREARPEPRRRFRHAA